MRRIALEEHFTRPDLSGYSQGPGSSMDREGFRQFETRLVEFDGMGLEAMDKAGLELAVLSVATPGVQAIYHSFWKRVQDLDVPIHLHPRDAYALSVLGENSIMLSVNDPYEDCSVASEFIETAPISDETRSKICCGKAEQLLHI